MNPSDSPAHGAPVRLTGAHVIILLVALLVRLVFVSTLGQEYLFADTTEYRESALAILAGHAPGPYTPRAPVYPAFMALGFLLGGVDNLLLLRLAQTVLALLMTALVMWLGERVGRRSTGLLAGVGVALSPTLVFSTGLLYPTTLYSLLLLALTTGALALAERPRAALGIALGVVLAVGLQTDQVMVAPGAAILAWLAMHIRRTGRALALALALFAITAVALNTAYIDTEGRTPDGRVQFVGKAQWTLWWARTDSTMTGTRRIHWDRNTPFRQLEPGEFFAREAGYLRTRPLDYLHDFAYEAGHFFWPGVDRLQTANRFTDRRILLVGSLHFWPVLLLAGLGLLAGAAAWNRRLLMLLVIAATAGFYALFFTQTRYRIPVEPEFAVLAALGLERLFPRLSALVERGRGQPAGHP